MPNSLQTKYTHDSKHVENNYNNILCLLYILFFSQKDYKERWMIHSLNIEYNYNGNARNMWKMNTWNCLNLDYRDFPLSQMYSWSISRRPTQVLEIKSQSDVDQILENFEKLVSILKSSQKFDMTHCTNIQHNLEPQLNLLKKSKRTKGIVPLPSEEAWFQFGGIFSLKISEIILVKYLQILYFKNFL